MKMILGLTLYVVLCSNVAFGARVTRDQCINMNSAAFQWHSKSLIQRGLCIVSGTASQLVTYRVAKNSCKKFDGGALVVLQPNSNLERDLRAQIIKEWNNGKTTGWQFWINTQKYGRMTQPVFNFLTGKVTNVAAARAKRAFLCQYPLAPDAPNNNQLADMTRADCTDGGGAIKWQSRRIALDDVCIVSSDVVATNAAAATSCNLYNGGSLAVLQKRSQSNIEVDLMNRIINDWHGGVKVPWKFFISNQNYAPMKYPIYDLSNGAVSETRVNHRGAYLCQYPIPPPPDMTRADCTDGGGAIEWQSRRIALDDVCIVSSDAVATSGAAATSCNLYNGGSLAVLQKRSQSNIEVDLMNRIINDWHGGVSVGWRFFISPQNYAPMKYPIYDLTNGAVSDTRVNHRGAYLCQYPIPPIDDTSTVDSIVDTSGGTTDTTVPLVTQSDCEAIDTGTKGWKKRSIFVNNKCVVTSDTTATYGELLSVNHCTDFPNGRLFLPDNNVPIHSILINWNEGSSISPWIFYVGTSDPNIVRPRIEACNSNGCTSNTAPSGTTHAYICEYDGTTDTTSQVLTQDACEAIDTGTKGWKRRSIYVADKCIVTSAAHATYTDLIAVNRCTDFPDGELFLPDIDVPINSILLDWNGGDSISKWIFYVGAPSPYFVRPKIQDCDANSCIYNSAFGTLADDGSTHPYICQYQNYDTYPDDSGIVCNTASADVFFLIDGSGSVTAEGFEKVKDFMARFVNDIPPGDSRVGAVQFETKQKTEFSLNTYDNLADAAAYFKTMPFNDGGTNLGAGIQYTIDNELVAAKGFRKDGVNTFVIMTDGDSDDNPSGPAAQLRQLGTVIAVGVSSGVNSQELLDVVGGDSSKIYTVDSFDALDDNLKNSLLSETVCRTVSGTGTGGTSGSGTSGSGTTGTASGGTGTGGGATGPTEYATKSNCEKFDDGHVGLDKKSRFIHNHCIVSSRKSVTYEEAKKSCNDFFEGQLLVINGLHDQDFMKDTILNWVSGQRLHQELLDTQHFFVNEDSYPQLTNPTLWKTTGALIYTATPHGYLCQYPSRAPTKFQQECEALPVEWKLYAYGTCFVNVGGLQDSVLDRGRWDDWPSKCNKLPNGRLAAESNSVVLDIFEYMKIWSASPELWLGLYQTNKTSILVKETDDNFRYIMDDKGTERPVVGQTFWQAGQPNAPVGEYCVFHGNDHKWHDYHCTIIRNYACQYDNPTPNFELIEDGMKGNSMTQYSQKTFTGATGEQDCLSACGNDAFCFAFSYKKSDGTCLFHWDVALSLDNPPFTDADYRLWSRY